MQNKTISETISIDTNWNKDKIREMGIIAAE